MVGLEWKFPIYKWMITTGTPISVNLQMVIIMGTMLKKNTRFRVVYAIAVELPTWELKQY